MRLLNTRTQQFRELSSNDSLDYAILSHRWLEGEEVSYQEFLLLTAGDDLIGTSTALYRRSALEQKRSSSGFRKIERACQRAVADGLGWIWIDACCIDKSSSAELSEAINSMWLWYKMSKICYAYLADVDCEDGLTSESSQKSFQNSRWWSRGWTLQELLAPKQVVFYDKRWYRINDRCTIAHQISNITCIESNILKTPLRIPEQSINTKMCWAASRRTTRTEDEAYCLLGLFDVHMSLLYGEVHNAFIRLQKEIINRWADESILAQQHYRFISSQGTFCRYPADFRLRESVNCGLPSRQYTDYTQLGNFPFSVTNKGLQCRAAFVRGASTKNFAVIALACYFTSKRTPFTLVLYQGGRQTSVSENYLVVSHNMEPDGELPEIAHCRKLARDILQAFSDAERKPDPFDYKEIRLIGHYSGVWNPHNSTASRPLITFR